MDRDDVRRDGVGRPVSRRALLGAAGLGGLAAMAAAAARARVTERSLPAGAEGTPAAALAEELTIDLPSEPPTLDPAIVYDVNAWSVVHSVYDSLDQYGPDGQLEPLLAEALTLLDPLTYEVKLRQGVLFHNGEPFDARSVAFSVGHLQAEATGSQVRDLFLVIREVQEIDPLTVRLALIDRPAPRCGTSSWSSARCRRSIRSRCGWR